MYNMDDADACCHLHTLVSTALQENKGGEKEREARVKGSKKRVKGGRGDGRKEEKASEEGGKYYNSIRKMWIFYDGPLLF